MARIISIPSYGSESYQEPVQSIGDLSGDGNNLGDIRLVKDTGGLYYWNGATWAYVVASDASGATQYKPETVIVLSGGNITSKSVSLTEAPLTANKTRMWIIGGTIQEYGADFTISGTTLSWNGLALDGFLEAGDKIIVTYN